MGSREIRSPVDHDLETSTPKQGMDWSRTNSDTSKRKKLGNYFMESDDRRRALGGDYTVGSTPVNIHRKPMSHTDLSKTGGWGAAFFIFGKFSLLFLIGNHKAKHYSLGKFRCID